MLIDQTLFIVSTRGKMKRFPKILSLFLIATSVWLHLLLDAIRNNTSYRYILIPLPMFCAVAFLLYATTVVLYRTFTFNNCEVAAAQLQAEIEEAKEALKELHFDYIPSSFRTTEAEIPTAFTNS